MKLIARASLLLLSFLVSSTVYAQRIPLFPVPELSKFAVHIIACTDRATPHKLIIERYELYRETRTEKFPVNAFADVITIAEEKVNIMTYYVFDGFVRVYSRQFIKTDADDWKEFDEKDFDEILQQYMAKLPREYFATGTQANHSIFSLAPGVLNCR
jgi:hypothetical protein